MAQKLNKDAVYKAAKPKPIDYSISDGGGCFFLSVQLVQSSGDSFTRLTVSEEKSPLGFIKNQRKTQAPIPKTKYAKQQACR
ncbi:MAG: hypothetical protein ABL919_08530 [Methylococcales bacterium]|nr:hypothetical protein [Methylococcaceae bacterium]